MGWFDKKDEINVKEIEHVRGSRILTDQPRKAKNSAPPLVRSGRPDDSRSAPEAGELCRSPEPDPFTGTGPGRHRTPGRDRHKASRRERGHRGRENPGDPSDP